METKIPTNYGFFFPDELFDLLNFQAYCYQRDSGMTHEDCMKIGLGKEDYNERYEIEKLKIQQAHDNN